MEKKRHYYMVALASERGKRISELLAKGREAADAADLLAKELGAESRTDRPGSLLPGVGIGSLSFKRRPSSKRYIPIGAGEYIPDMKRKEGFEIGRRIGKLPDISGFDFCVAFGISVDKKVTPEWYVCKGIVYLSCPYTMGEEYTAITEEEFELHKGEAE